jgi:glycosyltransferase involved in cell wall biosynthesis
VEPPRVSVVLPVRDGAATLDACLRSIARQREARFECLVLDDGSRDESRAIAEAMAARDPRFVPLALGAVGLIAALNEGLARARAPFVARMDADDLMARDRLGAELVALEGDERLSAVGCHVRLFPRAGLSAGLRAYERWLNAIDSPERLAREAFVECPVAHPTLVLRRSVALDFGYRDRGWPEDWDLVHRLLGAGQRIGMVPRRLLLWRDGPARLSRTHPRYRLDAFTACRAHYLARGFLGASPRYVLWGYGDTGKTLSRALAALGKTPCAIVEVHPGRIGQRIGGAPVIAPADLVQWRGSPIVVSVAGREARAEIRAALEAMLFDESSDYLCCA